MSRLPTIKRRQDFLSASKHGARTVTATFILQAHKRGPDHPAGRAPRVGFTVTKKMGNAVARNRIKRRLREAVRRIIPLMQDGHDYVFISRQPAFDCPFEKIIGDMEFAFKKLQGKSVA